jgi:hypothetical protein
MNRVFAAPRQKPYSCKALQGSYTLALISTFVTPLSLKDCQNCLSLILYTHGDVGRGYSCAREQYTYLSCDRVILSAANGEESQSDIAAR